MNRSYCSKGVKLSRELLDIVYSELVELLEEYVPLLTLGKIEYNELMRKYFVIILCAMCLMLLASTTQVRAGWDCVDDGSNQIPVATNVWRCIESPTNTAFRTLRGCLRCQDDLSQNERPYTEGGVTTSCNTGGGGINNKCKDDPRYVMRNFAALNFWSVGKGLSLAVPLVIVGGGLLCLVFMLFGAYTYITSGGEEKKLTDAMHMITYAGLGLLVIVIGYAAVRTILFITKINTFGF